MVEVWFAIVCLAVTLFAVLDGWNIGAGALHLIAGRTGAERREIVAALGPMWSWHEVWLLAFGGTFLLAFPAVMAAAFAGFYLALWLVLWSFILRGISLEVGGHLDDPLWHTWWDFVFAVSSVVLAVLFGAALGNVIRGVPLDATGKFTMSFFTHFGVRGRVGILDWYTVSVAVFTTVLLAAHGAAYLRLKTTVRSTIAANVWPGASGRSRSSCFSSSQPKPGSCALPFTRRCCNGRPRGSRSRWRWRAGGRSSRACAARPRPAPLRDRAR